MTTHTPGPWVVIPRGESSGHSVGTIEPAPETMIGVNYWTIAEVNGLRAQWESNLHLIAAAPDLLEALRELDECYCQIGPGGELSKADRYRHRKALMNARAAVRAATGEYA